MLTLVITILLFLSRKALGSHGKHCYDSTDGYRRASEPSLDLSLGLQESSQVEQLTAYLLWDQNESPQQKGGEVDSVQQQRQSSDTNDCIYSEAEDDVDNMSTLDLQLGIISSDTFASYDVNEGIQPDFSIPSITNAEDNHYNAPGVEESTSTDRYKYSQYWKHKVCWMKKDLLTSRYQELTNGPRHWCRGRLGRFCNGEIERDLLSPDIAWQAVLKLGLYRPRSDLVPGSAKTLSKDVKVKLYSYIMKTYKKAFHTARQIVSDGLKMLSPERRKAVAAIAGNNEAELQLLYSEFYPLHLGVQKQKNRKRVSQRLTE